MYVKSRPNASLGICLKIDFAGFYYHFPVKSMKSAQKLPNVNQYITITYQIASFYDCLTPQIAHIS